MTQTLIDTIFSALINSDSYTRKAIPFLKKEYFTDTSDKILFDQIQNFITKYNALPTKEALFVSLEKENINQELYDSVHDKISELEKIKFDENWLLDETEKFCQDRAIYNALMESIAIAQGESKNQTTQAIPDILKGALAVSFDTNVGHDYLNDSTSRYEFYHNKEEKFKFDIEMLNKITDGGVEKKSLNLILGGTGFGKSLILCHLAAGYMMQGKNVVYITMEMKEEKISERIDANLLDISLSEMRDIPKMVFDKKLSRLREKCQGKLIVKEYPTATAHVGHFRHFLYELDLKKNFKPDVIIIDYLNICMSSRIKGNSSTNMYGYVKAIAEELRGLAVEQNVPLWTASQLNREGIKGDDPDITNTSESMGLAHTADFMLIGMSNEELENQKKIIIKQVKNRYGDVNKYKRFVVGIDRPRMRLFDVVESTPVTQSSDDNEKPQSEFAKSKSVNKRKVTGLGV